MVAIGKRNDSELYCAHSDNTVSKVGSHFNVNEICGRLDFICVFSRTAASAYRLLNTWVVLYFTRSFRGLLTVKVVSYCENRIAGELCFLYVLYLN